MKPPRSPFAAAPDLGKFLASFNLFRESDNSIHVTVASATGVREELGDSGAPLHLCAMNALRAAVELRSPGTPNLSTDPAAVAAYDEDGSWGRMSEGWPETDYNTAKWLLCTKAEVVPYGSYVVVGGKIRVASEQLKLKLEKAFEGMFVECRSILLQHMEGKSI